MKKIFAAGFILSVAFVLGAFTFPVKKATPPTELKWYTWEEAVILNETTPKKMIIDVFTDWCGWCKKMDKSTFMDPAVVEYLQANFYPVKFNAEQKAEIEFNGTTFKYMDSGDGRGVHTLAYSLLDGQMSYPTVVYLNENYERIMISPGYKEVPALMKELKFAAEEQYNKTTWEKYSGEN